MKKKKNGHWACKASPRVDYLVRLGFVLVMLSYLPGLTVARPEPSATIEVQVYNNAAVPPKILIRAEREVVRIFGATGVEVAWIDCLEKLPDGRSKDVCQGGWTSRAPGLRLISGTNRFLCKELGVASIPLYATIYYEEIAHRAHKDNSASELPILLGCVIAHELGHLLGVHDHSTLGIMQPQWGASQIRQALMGRLLFTKEQTKVIKGQVLMALNH